MLCATQALGRSFLGLPTFCGFCNGSLFAVEFTVINLFKHLRIHTFSRSIPSVSGISRSNESVYHCYLVYIKERNGLVIRRVLLAWMDLCVFVLNF